MKDKEYIQSLQNSVAFTSDEAAYKHLFYYFHPLLKRFAYNIHSDIEVADEVVSDVLLKIWIMRQQLAHIADLKLYLFKATKNAVLNYLNSAAYRKKLITDEMLPGYDISEAPEAAYAYTEMQQLILKAIQELPPKCQMVFRLVKEYGLSYRQISEVMEISQNTIETHMRLALKKLKQVIDSYLTAGK
ncbi:MAG: RNA polymerase sigma-70 factor [Niabella sp.]